MSVIRKDKNPTAAALIGIAAIQVLIGFFGWSLYGDHFGWFDWAVTFSGGIYLLLGVAARWARLAAALIGAGLYIAYLLLQAFRSVDLLMSGLILKVPVVALLCVAVVFALRRSPAPPELPTSEQNVSA